MLYPMQEMKIIFGAVAALLAVVGYIPYIKDTVQRKTTPHPYSWFLWTLQTAIVYALQVINGAGAGSWMTLVITIMSVLIFVLSLKNGKAHITVSDTIYLVITLLVLFLWLVVKEPVLSVIIITAIDVLTFVPTVRKTWNKPYSETAFTYELGVFSVKYPVFQEHFLRLSDIEPDSSLN
jgi:hypothetical protein